MSRALRWRVLVCLVFVFGVSVEIAGVSAGVLRDGAARIPMAVTGASACVPGSIQCDGSKSGQLATDDCILEDKSYVDYYTFQGTAGYTVTIDMASTAIDTYLLLFDPSGYYADSNDDTNTTNSRLTFRLNRSGTWTIGATSARAYEIGNYSLSLQCADLGLPNLTPHRPADWTDKITVATAQNATSDSPILPSGIPLYVRWSVINSGRVAVDPYTTVYVEVLIDGAVRTRGRVDEDWPANTYFYWSSYNIGSLPAGDHTIRIRADSTNAVQESDEGDNEYAKTFTVTPPPPAASFSFSPTTPTINQLIQFSETSIGNPTTWLWDFGDGSTATERNPVHSYSVPGVYTVRLTATNAGGSTSTARAVGVTLPPPCVPGSTKLCLNGNRFGVQVSWNLRGRGGGAGTATAVRLTGDTGYFWFFSPNNVELVVKVVDGRAFNDRYWVFYGAMSDVEYVITVTDSATGRVRTYFNASGTLASVADTAAFAPNDMPEVPLDAGLNREVSSYEGNSPLGESESIPSPVGPASFESCAPDPFALCLNAGRFAIEVTWSSAAGGGLGNAMTLTSDTGYFWFFSPTNIELVIKVVDGRPVNGFFWVFYGALSDVAYTITVTDTITGAVKRYTNPQGRLASTADAAAFH